MPGNFFFIRTQKWKFLGRGYPLTKSQDRHDLAPDITNTGHWLFFSFRFLIYQKRKHRGELNHCGVMKLHTL